MALCQRTDGFIVGLTPQSRAADSGINTIQLIVVLDGIFIRYKTEMKAKMKEEFDDPS